MLKGDHKKAEETTKELAYAEKHTLHAYLIDWKEARDLLGEDNVVYLKPGEEEWT